MLKSPATTTGWLGVHRLLHVAAQAGQPLQLVLVVLLVQPPTVRHVDRRDADPTARGRDQPRLGIGRLAVREAGDHVPDADPRQHGDTVPLALAVVGGGVAERLEGQRGEAVVGQLRLLHADDVGLHLRQPRLHPGLADPQRVDVPGRDPHDADPTRRPRRSAGTAFFRPRLAGAFAAAPPAPTADRSAAAAPASASAGSRGSDRLLARPGRAGLLRRGGCGRGSPWHGLDWPATACGGRGAVAFFRVRFAGAGAAARSRRARLGRAAAVRLGRRRRRAFFRVRLADAVAGARSACGRLPAPASAATSARGAGAGGRPRPSCGSAWPGLGAGAGGQRLDLGRLHARHAQVDAPAGGVEADDHQSRPVAQLHHLAGAAGCRLGHQPEGNVATRLAQRHVGAVARVRLDDRRRPPSRPGAARRTRGTAAAR